MISFVVSSATPSLYFAFLASILITSSLSPSLASYSILYSFLLFLWSVVLVGYWRIRERLYAVAWCSLAQFASNNTARDILRGRCWWMRELKILFSVPVIILFASVLVVLLTAIFVFEAFVTTLYIGPVIFPNDPFRCNCPSLPRNLSDTRAKTDLRPTQWENQKHRSSFDTSRLSIALSSVVAYLGLALSDSIYTPFGETVMNTAQ
ncbi:hypothetical protein V8E52_003645 [Russula decolorans]